MQSLSHSYAMKSNPEISSVTQDALVLAFIRNRLNVIGTSMYLLENVGESDPFSRQKYINKIKYELEIIRKSINE
ncbi:MAG: hypothetical protein R3C41_02925 [Calditrichia bacterium]|nr:hypothetical protein [Calditrichota bacterium]MCB9067554.1 hypothetical protein [Calditrichia bacterium]